MEEVFLGSAEGSESEEASGVLAGARMALQLRNKSSGSSLESYSSTDGESLLDELLGDIRRSRTTSLASTPTHVSSECDLEAADGVRDCGRSEAELKRMSLTQLECVRGNLEHDVDTVSRLLVRLLHVRDKRAGKLVTQYDKLSSILKNYAEMNKLSTDLHFSLRPPETEEDYHKWLTAWIVLSRLPKGIPKRWRKTLWSCQAEHGTQTVIWQSQFGTLFSEFSTPEDETLGSQIVKDLHRTGTTGFTSEAEHGMLKRVLLAYARFNKAIGYCQGINILAAVILKVVGFDEEMALVILAYLIDHILPENYFAQNLYALSADMAVFRDLLHHYLPELALHMETLQKEASGTIRKSYSSESPPDIQSIHAYEPPLADVFSMQWFLTMFAAVLPRKIYRRIWDAIFLEGSDYLLYTAVATLAVMEKDLLQTSTAADFYSTMSRLCDHMRKAKLLSTSEFLQVVYAVRDYSTSADSTIPRIKDLRKKYTYNIYPCGLQPTGEGGGGGGGGGGEKGDDRGRPMAPLPSRGGCFGGEGLGKRKEGEGDVGRKDEGGRRRKEKHNTKKMELRKEEVEEEDGRNSVEKEVHSLRDHYSHVTKQPSKISCNMQLATPSARAFCPQQLRDPNPIPYYLAYAADVPLDVIRESRDLSGFDLLETLHDHRKDQFTLSFSHSDRQLPTLALSGQGVDFVSSENFISSRRNTGRGVAGGVVSK